MSDPARFVDSVRTRHGLKLAVRPEIIEATWRQAPEIGERMMRSRAELMSNVRTRDAEVLYSWEKIPHPPHDAGFTHEPKTTSAGMRSLKSPSVGDDESENLIPASLGGPQDPDRSTAPPQDRPDQHQVLATLPPPAAGMIYVLEGDDAGNYNVRLRPAETARTMGVGDSRIAAMNRRNRDFWRDADARKYGIKDSLEYTLFGHRPGPGERLELRGPDELGGFQLVLIVPDRDDEITGAPGRGKHLPAIEYDAYGSRKAPPRQSLTGTAPPGGDNQYTADHGLGSGRMYTPAARQRDMRLNRQFNEAARRMWSHAR